MSLAERDELIQKLNNALNMVCEEVENVKKRVNKTENPHMKNILPESENEQGAKLAMKQVSSTIKKKSSDSV